MRYVCNSHLHECVEKQTWTFMLHIWCPNICLKSIFLRLTVSSLCLIIHETHVSLCGSSVWQPLGDQHSDIAEPAADIQQLHDPILEGFDGDYYPALISPLPTRLRFLREGWTVRGSWNMQKELYSLGFLIHMKVWVCESNDQFQDGQRQPSWRDKTWHVGIFLNSLNLTKVKLCMTVVLTEIYQWPWPKFKFRVASTDFVKIHSVNSYTAQFNFEWLLNTWTRSCM